MNNMTNALVQRVFSAPKWEALKADTRENLQKGLLDYLVCCYTTVAYDTHFHHVWSARLFPGVTDGTALVIGRSEKVHPYDACFLNGYAAHALDLDDVHSDIRGHPSAVILSLLMALLEQKQHTARFFEAYLIGVEVMTRVSKTLGKVHYEKGFHTTATAGLYGAVAAGAYYMTFQEEEYNQALDLCVSQISGSRSHFGTLIKPLHAGLTAQKAWQILHFVKNNVVGNANTLADDNGLLSMFGNEDSSLEGLLDGWGLEWAVDKPGFWFKLYPCCSANAHSIDAVKELIENDMIDAKQIAAIQLYFPENGDAALIYKDPINGEQGRFSAEYCVALLLTGRELSMDAFLLEEIPEEIKELMEKTTRVYDENIEFASVSYPANRYSIVEMTMLNGDKKRARCDIPHGSPGNPLNWEDLLEKAKNLLHQDAIPLIEIFQQGKAVTLEKLINLLEAEA
ncbi:MmgE/PrpD family protein [Oceanobacillus sp. CFH 90083]|uniref:MmgE/PrpD family protein n=1 Tax=Oceanobacillus sp. CFH 90083 TaxID=2592336 RepID=UPI00128D1578|nr:MmgE/PrpD family protein [Oceanobacillus sp. CFH 90083]